MRVELRRHRLVVTRDGRTVERARIGHDVSHGCIRVANAVVARLARRLPLGTPVTIAR